MIKRLLLTFLMNLIFAWSLYLLGWQYWDMWAFLLVIPLVLSVSLTLSAGHWALWNDGNYSKKRLLLNAGFNIIFAWVCYYAAWYDKRHLPIVVDGLNLVLLMAISGVLVHWAIGTLRLETVEKAKRDHLDSVLRDLSDSDLLRLKQRLTSGTISDEQLATELLGADGELLDERH